MSVCVETSSAVTWPRVCSESSPTSDKRFSRPISRGRPRPLRFFSILLVAAIASVVLSYSAFLRSGGLPSSPAFAAGAHPVVARRWHLRHDDSRLARHAAASVEVFQDDCYAGTCGVWELESLAGDVKDTERKALGVEIRSSSVTVMLAELSSDDVEVVPSRVELPLHADMTTAEFSVLLADVIAEAAAPFGKWKGVVGCSVTRNVLRSLEYGDNALSKALEPVLKKAGIQSSFVHAMTPTEAAGCAGLDAARAAGTSSEWRKLVLVATLGANWGGVLFDDGHRIRRSGLKTMVTPGWADQDPSANVPQRLPTAGDPEWAEYIRRADRYIMEMADLVRPDRIVLMPTGVAATRKERLPPSEFIPLLKETHAAEQAGRFTIGSPPSAPPENAVVRGAALSALVELRLVRARLAIRKAVDRESSIERLSRPQLRAVYDAFSESATDRLSLSELERGLEAIGLTQDAGAFFAEDLSEDAEGKRYMTFKDFCDWWNKCILDAQVVTMTDPEVLDMYVRKTPEEIPGGFGPLLVAEITFSFCRACKSFVRKYEKLATENKDVRFVTLVANHNRAGMEFMKDVHISKAPAFLIYRRGTDINSPMSMWAGTNLTRCKEYLRAARERVVAST